MYLVHAMKTLLHLQFCIITTSTVVSLSRCILKATYVHTRNCLCTYLITPVEQEQLARESAAKDTAIDR